MDTDQAELYPVRWKGRPLGSYSRDTIQNKVRTGEFSPFHEVRMGDRWVMLRNFLGQEPSLGTLPSSSPPAGAGSSASEATGSVPEITPASDQGRSPYRLRRDPPPATVEALLTPGPGARVPCPQCGASVELWARFCSDCGANLQGQLAVDGARANASAPVQYAGFRRRLTAAFVDGLVLAAIGCVLVFAVGSLLTVLVGNPFGSDAALNTKILGLAFLIITWTLSGWIYFAMSESSDRQATLGKRAVEIVVTDLQGGRLSFGRATGRYLAKALSAVTIMAGFAMAGFTEKKQALHDLLAGCVVVVKQ